MVMATKKKTAKKAVKKAPAKNAAPKKKAAPKKVTAEVTLEIPAAVEEVREKLTHQINEAIAIAERKGILKRLRSWLSK
jgi:TfoX/Sxy family transcriptional regulator of competence genes